MRLNPTIATRAGPRLDRRFNHLDEAGDDLALSARVDVRMGDGTQDNRLRMSVNAGFGARRLKPGRA